VVEHKLEALDSIPSSARKEKEKEKEESAITPKIFTSKDSQSVSAPRQRSSASFSELSFCLAQGMTQRRGSVNI
jgi:hypothetical protein